MNPALCLGATQASALKGDYELPATLRRRYVSGHITRHCSPWCYWTSWPSTHQQVLCTSAAALMEAALLELLAATTWAWVVSTDALEEINNGQGRVGQGEAKTLNARGSPLLISLGCI